MSATSFWRGIRVTAVSSAFVCAAVAAAGYFDRDPYHLYPAQPPLSHVAVVNVSGDMGLRFLLGASTSRGLTEHHVPVLGVSSPAVFRSRRTRAEVDAFVADAIRNAVARTGKDRIVVMGQSYGADIVQTGLANLPADLRAHVAGIVLILPGDTVFFRADPTGWAYRGTPDSIGRTTGNTLTWAPLTCIYGQEEDDSLCPQLRIPGATIVAMPGGHNLHHDSAGLFAHVWAAIARVTPPASPRSAAAPRPAASPPPPPR
ncbi:type IV secretory pathway VirJ component [Sphingomonas sp. BE138]|uniref:AcvB/VirJ family lysyl-phosphatidylglycerol hydrolase n=1 Tax=Sphingomonas sp. BE138 TaxID=2817845 RepID=UPI00285C59A6|nr:AcvB/VirJ family lysyl-phosphatidylglycerol hydrolase [Sphingomonas sp. BE138]MDR6789387.1 type IV secretory pathway VirJ component [Sphingomonas sp. BE138]